MKLTVMERVTLLQELPPHGDITSLRIVRELRENLGFSEKERKEIGFREGEDWTACPSCASADIEKVPQSPQDSANMHCRACNHKGLNGLGRLSWSYMGTTDIPIGEKATDIIAGVLKALNSKPNPEGGQGSLEDRHISLYEKFVEGKIEEVPSTNGKYKGKEPVSIGKKARR